MKGRIILGLWSVLFFSLSSLYGAVLFDGDKNFLSIKLSLKATASETMAEKELSLYLNKIANKKLLAGKKRVTFEFALMGRDKNIPSFIKKKLRSEKNKEAFYLFADQKKILVAGNSPVALLYGTYTFIEKYLGVRWFYPGEMGEYVPKKEKLEIGSIDDFQVPHFRFRRLCVVCVTGKHAETTLWMTRNKMNPEWRRDFAYPEFNKASGAYKVLGGHSIWQSSVPDSLFKLHPEYFPLVKGKRINNKRAQRCVSHPQVKKMLTEYILKNLARGDEYVMSFGVQDDVRYWCSCKNCIAYGTVNHKYEITNAVHRLYSEVSKEVLQKRPSAKIWVDFYINMRKLPADKSIRYDERVDGTYNAHQSCCAHPFYDPECPLNKPQYKEFVEWGKRGPKVNFRGYYSVNYAFYAPLEYTLAKDLKHFRKIGGGGWWDEVCAPNAQYYKNNPHFKEQFLTTWRYFYVAAKMLWDSSLDVKKLLNETEELYYGKKVSPIMKKFRNVLKEAWDNAPGHAYYGGPFRLGRALNIPGVEKDLWSLLEQAEKAALKAKDQKICERLAMDRRHLKLWGSNKAAEIRKASQGSKEIPLSKRSGKIVIDGALDEQDWKKAQSICSFRTFEGKKAAEETRIKVLHDEKFFYIGIQAMTENYWGKRAFKEDAVKRDGNVWMDDSCEIMVGAPAGRVESSYNHYVINTAGTLYDAKVSNGVSDPGFTSSLQYKVKKYPKYYVMELKIPVSELGMKSIGPGEVYKMHFVRSCNNLQPPNTNEGSSIDGVLPHKYDLYRTVITGRQVLPNPSLGILRTNKKNPPFLSETFPESWGGRNAFLQKDGSVKLKGYMMCWMRLPADKKSYTAKGQVTLCGKGTVYIWASTCVRAPGGKNKPFRHEIRNQFKYALKNPAKKEIFTFSFPVKPYQQGYFYISGNNINVYSASMAVAENNESK